MASSVLPSKTAQMYKSSARTPSLISFLIASTVRFALSSLVFFSHLACTLCSQYEPSPGTTSCRNFHTSFG